MQNMIDVMQAHMNGALIEMRHKERGATWQPAQNPQWDWLNCEYRVAVTPDTFDWTNVPYEWQFVARDGNGSAYAYTQCPIWYEKSEQWREGQGNIAYVRHYWTGHTVGTCHPRDSLICRR